MSTLPGRRHFLAMLRSPGVTGALVPSSRALAEAMAGASAGAETVIELGAGTGAITEALLRRRGVGRLVAVECQPALARGLLARFPGLHVECAPAADVLATFPPGPRVALVSSLPFRSLPRDLRARTIAAIEFFLSAHARSWLVQFTYQPRPSFIAPARFRWERVGTVWRNLPPAGVWKLVRD